MRQVRVLISGRVQRVFFRAETKATAKRLGLRGFVRNLHDGRVKALFYGEDSRVQDMLDWCRKGPPLSRVDSLSIHDEPATANAYSSFEIR